MGFLRLVRMQAPVHVMQLVLDTLQLRANVRHGNPKYFRDGRVVMTVEVEQDQCLVQFTQIVDPSQQQFQILAGFCRLCRNRDRSTFERRGGGCADARADGRKQPR